MNIDPEERTSLEEQMIAYIRHLVDTYLKLDMYQSVVWDAKRQLFSISISYKDTVRTVTVSVRELMSGALRHRVSGCIRMLQRQIRLDGAKFRNTEYPCCFNCKHWDPIDEDLENGDCPKLEIITDTIGMCDHYFSKSGDIRIVRGSSQLAFVVDGDIVFSI